MKKIILSMFFLLVILITPIVLFLKPSGGVLLDERRYAANFPTDIGNASQRSVKRYFAKIDSFVSDNFPARQAFILANRNVALAVNDDIDPANAFRGKDGWFFLGNNYNYPIDKYSGVKTLEPKEVLSRATELEAYVTAFRAYGVEPIFLIGPDKQNIYPEYLPDIIKKGPNRYITPIVNALKKDGVHIYDPTEELLQYKQKDILYYRTDTHWNLKSGELVATSLLKQWHLNPPPPYGLKIAKSFNGDLVSIAYLTNFTPFEGDNYEVEYQKPMPNALIKKAAGAPLAFTLGKMTDTDDTLFINPDATNHVNLWIVGDSFTQALQPFLFSAISNIQMYHIQNISAKQLEEKLKEAKEKPQYA